MRRRAVWGGMLLYVISAIYVCYLGVRGGLSLPVWNALFWIILLFAAFNALARSFQREDADRQHYLHSLASPQAVILARGAYAAMTMMVLSLLSLLCYILLLGGPVIAGADLVQFIVVVMVGGAGLAAVLTLISAISARAGNGIGLMAVLGFPVVLPMLLSIMRASKGALDGLSWSSNSTYLLWVFAVDVLTVTLSYLLFPYLWRD
ncbi:MAG: heme exporter protein CcmB [Flavobacteriales bacterium]|nr:heme exporter protein CcmB [Flavobacteriales bacterium]